MGGEGGQWPAWRGPAGLTEEWDLIGADASVVVFGGELSFVFEMIS